MNIQTTKCRAIPLGETSVPRTSLNQYQNLCTHISCIYIAVENVQNTYNGNTSYSHILQKRFYTHEEGFLLTSLRNISQKLQWEKPLFFAFASHMTFFHVSNARCIKICHKHGVAHLDMK